MGNDLSTNQASPLPSIQLNKFPQLISKSNVVDDLFYDFNDKDNTAFVTGIYVDHSDFFIPRSIKSGLKEYTIIGIKESSFEELLMIESIHFAINNEIRIIEKNAFYGSGLTTITVPPSVLTIGESAFCKCKYLRTIEFSENSKLHTIGKMAFSDTSIREIKIPSHVTIICEKAFFHCYQLNLIEFTENSELQTIGKMAFSNSSIRKIKIPSHVTIICENAFFNCYKLNSIEFTENSELQTIEGYIIKSTNIKSFTIPKKVVTLNDGWLDFHCEEIKIMDGNKHFKYYEDIFIVGKSDPASDEYDELIFACPSIKEAIIPPFIKKIRSFSFRNSNIENIFIPPHVKEIGDYAFNECRKLKTVVFAENSELQIISKFAFSNICIEITIIPAGFIKLKEGFLANSEYLKNDERKYRHKKYEICKDVFIVGENNQQVEKFDPRFIPHDINEINTFSQTESITIPESVVEICEKAFSKSKINEIKFAPNSKLTIIHNNAFDDSNIQSIIIPKRVKIIGSEAFKNSKLNKIEFEDHSKLEKIESYAFAYTAIEKIIIPYRVKKISIGTFQFCRNLKEIEFPEK